MPTNDAPSLKCAIQDFRNCDQDFERKTESSDDLLIFLGTQDERRMPWFLGVGLKHQVEPRTPYPLDMEKLRKRLDTDPNGVARQIRGHVLLAAVLVC